MIRAALEGFIVVRPPLRLGRLLAVAPASAPSKIGQGEPTRAGVRPHRAPADWGAQLGDVSSPLDEAPPWAYSSRHFGDLTAMVQEAAIMKRTLALLTLIPVLAACASATTIRCLVPGSAMVPRNVAP